MRHFVLTLCLLALPLAAVADPVLLTWTPSAGDVRSYKIYTKTRCADAPVLLAEVPATEHTFTVDVPVPTQDCWAVTAMDGQGVEVRSNIIAAYAAPSSQLHLELTDTQGLWLVWDPYKDGIEPVVGWQVERQLGCQGPPERLTTEALPAAQTRYLDKDSRLAPGQTLCWTVWAVQKEGRGTPYHLMGTSPPTPGNVHLVGEGMTILLTPGP